MDPSAFAFSIKPDGDGWIWTTRCEKAGRELARGRARSKREAAALVIRFIARSLHPGSAPPATVSRDLRRAA